MHFKVTTKEQQRERADTCGNEASQRVNFVDAAATSILEYRKIWGHEFKSTAKFGDLNIIKFWDMISRVLLNLGI